MSQLIGLLLLTLLILGIVFPRRRTDRQSAAWPPRPVPADPRIPAAASAENSAAEAEESELAHRLLTARMDPATYQRRMAELSRRQ